MLNSIKSLYCLLFYLDLIGTTDFTFVGSFGVVVVYLLTTIVEYIMEIIQSCVKFVIY